MGIGLVPSKQDGLLWYNLCDYIGTVNHGCCSLFLCKSHISLFQTLVSRCSYIFDAMYNLRSPVHLDKLAVNKFSTTTADCCEMGTRKILNLVL